MPDRTALYFASLAVLIGAAVTLLAAGRAMIMPFLIAVVVWFLINILAEYFRKVRIGGSGIPGWLALAAAGGSIVALLAVSIEILLRTVNAMMAAAPLYQGRFQEMVGHLYVLMQLEETPTLGRVLQQIHLQPLLVNVAAAVTTFAGNLVIIVIYVIFLLLEQRVFKDKLQALFPDAAQRERAIAIIERISMSIKTYLTVKTFVSVLTAAFSFLIMRAVDLNFAVFWAFLIFTLNFIPSLGSVAGTLFPSLMALLQFDTLGPFLVVAFGIGTIQLVIGNYVDPRLMGRSLNISPVVVMLSLGAWGSMWGITGMVLGVPITVILMIILAQFPETRPIATLLSEDGKVSARASEASRP